MENKTNLRRSVRPERRERFSIRKFNVGVASVAVAAFFMAGGSSVAATELSGTGTTEATTVTGGETTGETSPEATDAAEEAESAAPQAEEAKAEEAPVAEVAPEAPKAEEAPKTDEKPAEETPSAEVKAEETPKADAQPAESVTPTITTRVATEEAPVVAAPVRTAATTYRVQYIDAETGEQVKQENRSVNQETTNTKEEPVTFKVDIKLDAPTGYKAETASNNAGTEFAIVNNAIAAAIVEGNTATRTIKVLVRKDAAAASNNNTEGVSSLRAVTVGRQVIRDGETIVNVQNSYIRTNDANTKPEAWGFSIVFDTSKTEAGETTEISTKNLWEMGDAFKVGTEIKADDGTVIGTVTKKAYDNSADFIPGSGANPEDMSPYWGQRTNRGKTYDERVAEQPAVPNEVGTWTYTITWNDKAKFYAATSFTAENLSGAGYISPSVSVDTVYDANISVNGVPVVETTYTNRKVDPTVNKEVTRVDLITNNGMTYVNNNLTKKNDAITITTDTDIRYGVGSTFTITLPDDDFTYFKVADTGLKPVNSQRSQMAYRPTNRMTNVVANENNVWIMQDGRDTPFVLTPRFISPTEIEFTVTEGAIQEGSTMTVGLGEFGLEKVVTPETLSSTNANLTFDQLGRVTGGRTGNIPQTNGTLASVTGGTSINGEPENINRIVPNGWIVDASVSGDSGVQTAAVIVTLNDIQEGPDRKPLLIVPTKYKGTAEIREDGTFDTTNLLGNPYDVTEYFPKLVEFVERETGTHEYVLVNIPPLNTTGTLSLGPKRVSDIMSPEDIAANGLNPNAFINPVVYEYVRKVVQEDVNRIIDFRYDFDVAGKAGQPVEGLKDEVQKVTYEADVKLIADGGPNQGKAEVDENNNPIYINYRPYNNGPTELPEFTVPKVPGYIARTEVVPVQPTTPTDKDYRVTVYYTAEQNAITTFEYQDAQGNPKTVEESTPGKTPLTETGVAGDKLTKAPEINTAIAALEEMGYEVLSNNYPAEGTPEAVFDKLVDENGEPTQKFTVVVKERLVTIDPEKPENPPVPAGVTLEALTDTVTRNITYTYKDGNKAGQEAAPKKTETVEFTRVATINAVTKEVTYTDWKVKGTENETTKTLAEVASPDRTSEFYLLEDPAEATIAARTVTALEENTPNFVINIPVEYVAQKGGAVKVAYETDLGEKLKGGATTEVKPAGTQVGETYNTTAPETKLPMISEFGIDFLLTGVKENSAPENGSVAKDEQVVTYIYKAIQAANVRFVEVDKAGTEVKELDKLTTEEQAKDDKRLPGQPITFDRPVAEVIADLVKQGYEVVANDLPGTPTYDNTKDNKGNPSQAFTVKVTPRIIQTPNPQDPEIPAGVKVDALTKDITREINYKFDTATGPEAAPTKVQDPVTFTREVIINLVEALKDPANYTPTYTDWSADQTLPAVTSPTAAGKADLAGYTADKPVVEALTVKATDTVEPVTVIYIKDAQKAVTSFTYQDKDGKDKVVEGNTPIEELGKTGEPLTKATDVAEKIKAAEKAGYELVSNTYPENGTFDNVTDENGEPTQKYTVVVKERVVPVTKDNTPGTPVDPTDPNSPVYPTPSEEIVTEKTVTRTITYTYLTPEGEPVTEPVVQTVTFTRPATVNLVTGKVEFGAWSEDQKFAPVTSPTVADKPELAGYTANTLVVPEVPVKATDENSRVQVVYTKDDQKAVTSFTYQDKDGKDKVVEGNTPIEELGKTGEPLTKAADVAEKIKAAEKAGYELVSNTYPENGTFDNVTDENGEPTQKYTVVVKERVVPVTKDNTPGTPVDPTDPNSPVYPTPSEEIVTEKTVTRTITYTYLTPTGETASATVEQPVTFTRPATVNLVTGKVEFGTWSEDKLVPEVNSPIIQGFLADRATVGEATISNTTESYTENVVYKPLGQYIVNVPGQDQPTTDVYPNNPTDPTVPGEPTTVVPFVPGFTPVDGNDQPLKPVDPTDPTKGYVVPAIPADPSVDTPINYVKDGQKAVTTVVYQDKDGKVKDVPGNTPIEEVGESGAPLTKAAEIAAKIKELENAGYALISNNYPENGTFDTVKDENGEPTQNYTVVVKERVEPVTPDAPKVPGQPVDPNNPEGPKWPTGLEESDLNKAVTRTVTYVKTTETGEEVFDTKEETVTFTRTAEVNLVTGVVTYGDWTATNGDNVLNGYPLPVVEGYLAKSGDVASSQKDVTVTETSENITEKVVYVPLGKYIVNVPGKDQPTTDVYPNNPTDPTVPGEPTTVVPFVPGFTPVDGNGQPLKPVDPTDPTKGYVVPAIPTDPTVDTPINYITDDQVATITFKADETAKEPNKELGKVNETGKSGEKIPADAYKAKLVELEKAGYDVTTPVKDEFAGDKNFDNDKDLPQNFEVVVKERVVPVPANVKPGQPVDPTNPNSPEWPAGVDTLETVKEVTRTITYVNDKGETVSATVTEKVTFTRDAKVNLVTGEIMYGEWTSADNMFDTVKSPIVTGYLADTASVPGSTATPTDGNSSVVVTYKPLGQYIVNVPGQDQPTTDVYPNNPTDPTVPGTPTTVAPHVPGFTPVDGNGQPLKPVDPTDPTKGYVVPAIPTDPTVDTPINYTKDDQVATITFKADETAKEPNKELGKVNETGKSGEPISADAYKAKLVELEKAGYDVTTPVKDEFAGEKNFDNDKDLPQNFEVVVKERVVPVPADVKPGQPVDPTNPNSPVWPAGVDTLETVKDITRTITYVNDKGETVSATVTEKVTFTRDAKVNLVTGEIMYGEWTSADNMFDTVKSPVIPGYLADTAAVPGSTATPTDGDSSVVVTYKPIGKYIINVPGKDPINEVYPNNPEDPTKPGNPTTVAPHVPGFTPVDGNGQPLKPVDPTDPTKGYVVPAIPTDPSVDTPINYLPVPSVPSTPVPTTPETKEKHQVIVRYHDTDGKVIKAEVVDTETTMTGLPYDTTDNRPAEIVKDGVRYVLVPELTQGQEEGVVTAGVTYVTYVYKAVVETPAKPEMPMTPAKPAPAPMAPVQPAAPAQAAAKAPVAQAMPMLPETGDDNSVAALAGTVLLASAMGMAATRRRKED